MRHLNNGTDHRHSKSCCDQSSPARRTIISPQMRADILQGKDINLAALLMQGYDPEPELSQRTTHVPGGEAVSIRPRSSQSKDPRLSKNLTLPEFIKAFNIYSNVMCQGYPHRKGELDAYLTEIIGMATDFGAGTFYEYHKMFSARAATLLLNHNVKLDWSVRDNDMYCKLFAGRRAIACGICSSMAHSTDFCPLSTGFRNNRRLGGTGHFNKSENGVAQRGKGDGICHAFNSTKGCVRLVCRFAHACMVCRSAEHGRTHCQGSNPGTQAASSGAQAPAQIEAQVTQHNPARHNPSNHSQKKPVNPSNKWLPNFHEPTISVDQLEQELVNHPDKAFTDYLTSGCRNGFDVGLSEYPSVPYFCRNNLSARNDPIKTTELINDELRKGYLIGPFHEPPFEVYRINPISLAQKKYSDKKRLVVDLSAPHNDSENQSLNELISKEEFRLSYIKFEEAIEIIQRLGRYTWLCKTDLHDAFKQLPVREQDWPWLGIFWQDRYYFYTRLVFGCRSSPKIFDTLSQAIVWIAKHNYGISHMLHLLDDFLVLDAPAADADRSMAILTLIMNKLRLPYSKPKTVGPCTQLEYLGLLVDTADMQCRLPPDKLSRTTKFIHDFLGRSKCSKLELLSLLGHLSFAAKVIPPGHTFLYRLFRAAYSVGPLHFKVYLNKEAKADLEMWAYFLKSWHGVSLFIDPVEIQAEDMELYTDASGSIGYGGMFQRQWFCAKWQTDLALQLSSPVSISFQELYPIVVAAMLWGSQWSRRRIVFHCDNFGTVHIINKGCSKSADIMRLMRRLTLVAARYSFTFTAKHLPGKKNKIVDCLSRLQLTEFRKLAPHALPKPCQIPSDVMFG